MTKTPVTSAETFDLDAEFAFYLESVQLHPDRMAPGQLTETRRAFVAGLAQMFIIFSVDLSAIENEEETYPIFDKITQQIGEFWKSEGLDGKQGGKHKD